MKLCVELKHLLNLVLKPLILTLFVNLLFWYLNLFWHLISLTIAINLLIYIWVGVRATKLGESARTSAIAGALIVIFSDTILFLFFVFPVILHQQALSLSFFYMSLLFLHAVITALFSGLSSLFSNREKSSLFSNRENRKKYLEAVFLPVVFAIGLSILVFYLLGDNFHRDYFFYVLVYWGIFGLLSIQSVTNYIPALPFMQLVANYTDTLVAIFIIFTVSVIFASWNAARRGISSVAAAVLTATIAGLMLKAIIILRLNEGLLWLGYWGGHVQLLVFIVAIYGLVSDIITGAVIGFICGHIFQRKISARLT